MTTMETGVAAGVSFAVRERIVRFDEWKRFERKYQ